MTGLQIIKATGATAGEIADIISKPCPPIETTACDRISCRECWIAWLTTGESYEEEKGVSAELTPPGCDWYTEQTHKIARDTNLRVRDFARPRSSR